MAKKKANVPHEGHVSGQSNKPMSLPAHSLTHKELEAELKSDSLNGITPEDAAARLTEHGKNDLGEAEGVQPLRIVIAQFANAMTMVGSVQSGVPGPRAQSPGSKGPMLPGAALLTSPGSHPRHGGFLWF